MRRRHSTWRRRSCSSLAAGAFTGTFLGQDPCCSLTSASGSPAFGINLASFVEQLTQSRFIAHRSLLQTCSLALGSFDVVVYSCVYPALLLLALRHDQISGQFP